MKHPAVYLLASQQNGTLYCGVTSNLPERIWQHREGRGSVFTRRYGCKTLVYFEYFDEMLPAIQREKQIKAGSRRAKLALIEAVNPDWMDLYSQMM